MAGRKTKYNAEIHAKLVDLIAAGVTIKDASAYVGISDDTYHNWLKQNSVFSADITRAKGQAFAGATLTIRSAIQGQQQVTTTNDVITETKLRKIKQKDGTVEEVPYEYTKKVQGTTVTSIPPDWRAAESFLKRRDPEHWSDKTSIKFEDWRSQAIADIKAGLVQYEPLAEAFDESLAAQLFREAGVSIPSGTS